MKTPMPRFRILSIGTLAFLGSTIGTAQDKAEQKQIDRDAIFVELDLDGDEKLSQDEYAAGITGKMRKVKNEEFAAGA